MYFATHEMAQLRIAELIAEGERRRLVRLVVRPRSWQRMLKIHVGTLADRGYEQPIVAVERSRDQAGSETTANTLAAQV